MPNVPPCLQCGACCFSKLETYVSVTGADHSRLGEFADQISVFIGNRCYMRMEDGHCGALVLDACGRFCCRVYELRPDVCRSLERESDACLAERERKALGAQTASLGKRSPLRVLA